MVLLIIEDTIIGVGLDEGDDIMGRSSVEDGEEDMSH